AALVERLSVVGQAQRAGGARQQGDAQLALERGDAAADGRRRDSQAARRRREAPPLDGQGQELDAIEGPHRIRARLARVMFLTTLYRRRAHECISSGVTR